MHAPTRRGPTATWLFALLACLAAGLSGHQAHGQSIEDMIDRAEAYQGICFNNGGRSDRADYTFGAEEDEWIWVKCEGGLLDGRVCISRFTLEDSWCAFGLTQPPEGESIIARPEEAIELAPYQPVRSLDTMFADDRPWWERCSIVTGRCWPWSSSLEAPVPGQAVLTASQQGSTLESNALSQVNGCLASGGEAQASQDGSGVIVTCAGGLMDGLWCLVGDWGQVCSLFNLQPPAATQPQITSAGADPAPTPSPAAPPPPPAVEPVMQPPPTETVPAPGPTVAPTLAPTHMPAEPTVVPTLPPPPPSQDNVAPPVEAEDPVEAEPSPTPLVLT